MNKRFLAYFAGYIDGDGHFRFRKYIQDGYECFHCKLMITSTNKEPLEYFQKIVGGTFYQKKHTNKKWKPEYIYTLHIGKEVFYKIKNLGLFLKEKRTQFNLIYPFLKGSKSDKEKICEIAKSERNSFSFKESIFNQIKNSNISAKPTINDFHYFAGFLDAEGAFTVTQKTLKTGSKSFSCHIRISQTKYPAIEFIKKRFGGCLHFRKSIKKNTSDCVQWEITDKTVEPILKKLYPILIIKKPQCGKLMDLRDTFKNRKFPRDRDFISYYNHFTPIREKIYSSVKTLNKRGL